MSNGLFAEYMDSFLKIKQEASGWLCWVHTEEDKQKSMDEWKHKEDITILVIISEK